MSRMRETLAVSVRVLKRLSVPHHTLRSWSMVAKREKLSDDRVARELARATELVGGDLLWEMRENRLLPTELGREFCKAAEALLNLEQGDTIEVLSVGVAPSVDAVLVARAISAFVKEWSPLVGFKLTVFSVGIREAVESNQIAFGIVDASELDETDERLKPAVPLVALIPTEGHRLAGAGGPLDREHFTASDRVYFSPRLAESLSDLLVRVPEVNRVAVECPQTLRSLIEDGAGIGFEYARPEQRSGDSFTRVPVLGVEPLMIGLVLPRKRERLTDPARYFLDVLRRGRELTLPPIPVAEVPTLPEVPELAPIPDPLSA